MKKTILVVIDQLGVGGAERQLTEILPRLDHEQFDIVVYPMFAKGDCAERLEAKAIKVISPPLHQRLNRLGGIGRALQLLLSMTRLTGLLWQLKPSLVHFYLPKAYLLGSICTSFFPRKTLVMSRRSLNDYQKKRPWLAKFEKKLHKKMTLILANSKPVFNQMMSEESVAENRLRLIYNGIEVDRYNQKTEGKNIRRELKISDQALVFIIVANLFSYKGHADLLNALSIAKNDLPSDWQLLVVGRDENNLSHLKQLSEQYDLQQYLHWLGERQDVPALLSAANIALLCSHQEGFSNSILEAMAASLPLIVTDVGGNSEAVINGETGIVIPPHDPTALANALVTLSSDKLLREKMAAAGYQRVKAHFSIERCVDNYNAVYTELTVDCCRGK